MPDPISTTVSPRYHECDPDGQLHTANYLRYALQAAIAAGAPGRAFRAVWRAGWQHLEISGGLDPAWLTQMLGDMDSRAAEARGWSAAREQEQGITWRAIEHRLELFEPIHAGDGLNITSY